MKPTRILIADDHQIIVDGVKLILADNPEFKVVNTARDGKEALEIIQTDLIDIAILDIQMPRLDGIDLARKILRNHYRTKIILLTMIGDGAYIYQAKKMGIHGYILKENSSNTLVDALHAVARGGKYWPLGLFDKMEDQKSIYEKKEPEVKFTKMQRVVLKTYSENPGLTSGELGAILNMASATVDTHFRNMMRKSGTNKRVSLLDYYS